LVNRTIVQGDGIDDNMVSGTLASRQYFTSYSASKLFEYSIEQPIYSSSSAKHLLYTVSFLTAYNDSNLISSNNSLNLNSQTIDFNAASSKIRINAGADTTGNSGTGTSTTIRLFDYSGIVYGNANLNTLIQALGIDNNTVKTSMYNVLKSINNNAF
jgi:hypothetical protein